MSKFKTSIPVDVEAVKAALPHGAFIHGVEFDKKASAVVLTWEHSKLKTPYTFATELDVLAVRDGRKSLPGGITLLGPIFKSAPKSAPDRPLDEESVPTADENPAPAAETGVDAPVESVPSETSPAQGVRTEEPKAAEPRRRRR